MGNWNGIYPLVNLQQAFEMAIEIADFDLPINSKVIFHSYVSLPEGIQEADSFLSHGIFNQQAPIKVASTGWTVKKWHVMTSMARVLQPSFSQMNCHHPSLRNPGIPSDRQVAAKSISREGVTGYRSSRSPKRSRWFWSILLHPASRFKNPHLWAWESPRYP